MSHSFGALGTGCIPDAAVDADPAVDLPVAIDRIPSLPATSAGGAGAGELRKDRGPAGDPRQGATVPPGLLKGGCKLLVDPSSDRTVGDLVLLAGLER